MLLYRVFPKTKSMKCRFKGQAVLAGDFGAFTAAVNVVDCRAK